ncbi:MAG: type II toxin-antitoxin system VapC family toxin [Deltaproteobacteria bacterium]|nr:type II toxin-antitoxin system VapC family toxin [Deltaproteobacteria bacterium]
MTLVDTSVWLDHLRHRNGALVDLLGDDQVACHSFVVGELACGHLRNRREILSLLAALPQADVVEHDEALAFLATHGLPGMGLGWIDVHVLASAVLAGTTLWTLDGSLRRAAQRLRVAY